MRRGLVLASVVLAVALPGAQAAQRPVPDFDHVIVIVFENKVRSSVLGNPAAPTFNSLAARHAMLSRYRGVTHPSLPNYLALVSGSTHGIRNDCTRCTVGGRSLADTLEASGRSWKAYAEGLPRPGWTGAASGRYVKRHAPFLYFHRVLARPRGCATSFRSRGSRRISPLAGCLGIAAARALGGRRTGDRNQTPS